MRVIIEFLPVLFAEIVVFLKYAFFSHVLKDLRHISPVLTSFEGILGTLQLPVA